LSRVFKPSTRVKLVSRGNSAAGENAVRGLELRAPEHEIPRLFGAGVGAGSLNLAFELSICPECGWRLIEHNGLLVCEGCGLVLAPVYEPPKFKPADSFNGFNGSSISSIGLAQRALEALAGELGVPAGAAHEVYKRLRRYTGDGEAAAIALFASAKRCGSYISLKRACELLSKCGVKAEYPRALKTMLAYAPLVRPTMEEALEAYAAKLGISESVKREALEIIGKVKRFAGGRDPYLVALAAA
jgi:rRNA maturation protein Nop10